MKGKRLLTSLTFLTLLNVVALSCLAQSKNTSEKAEKEFGFQLKNYKMRHQGGKEAEETTTEQTLNINVSYRHVWGIPVSEYPQVWNLKNKLNRFLVQYPSEMNYWEILNKDICKFILTQCPVIAEVRVEIHVSPTARQPYDRTSIVTCIQPDNAAENYSFKEAFLFAVKGYTMWHEHGPKTLNISASYDYCDDISDSQYPDFLPIIESMNRFLTNYPNETDHWMTINERLVATVLKEYPVLSVLRLELSVLATDLIDDKDDPKRPAGIDPGTGIWYQFRCQMPRN